MCVYSYREEFSSHGLSDVVSVECRDVCRDGFGLNNAADAGEQFLAIYHNMPTVLEKSIPIVNVIHFLSC